MLSPASALRVPTRAVEWVNERLRPADNGPTQHRVPDQILSIDDALARLKEQSTNHYAGIYNVMKGVTLAAAGLSAVYILNRGLPVGRWLLLVAAFQAVVLSYNGATVGRMIVHLYPSAVDSILPMALTVVEMVVVALPGFAEKNAGDVPPKCLIALAIWQILAGGVILSILRRLEQQFYEGTLWSAVYNYRERILFDWWCATGGGLALFLYLPLSRSLCPGGSAADYGVLIVAIFFFSMAIRHHGATRQELLNGLLEIAGDGAARTRT